VLAGGSGIRAIIPAAAASLYAVGVRYHILGGLFFWAVLVVVAGGLRPAVSLLPEKAEGRPRRVAAEEEERV
jgi:hypothetical protein